MDKPNRRNPRTYAYSFRDRELGISFLAESEVFVDYGPAATHAHPDWQVMFLVEGRMAMRMHDRVWKLAPGSVFVSPPHTLHTPGEAGQGTRWRFVDFRVPDDPGQPFVRHLQRLGVPGGMHVGVEVTRRLAEALRSCIRGQAAPSPAAVMGHLWQALAAVGKSRPVEDDTPDAADPRLRAADAYLLERLGQPVTPEQVAQAVDLSKSQLTRLYRRELNTSPIERLLHFRQRQAEQLLAHSLMSVKEIAAACGFSNANHFSRWFHERTAQTPTDFRHQAARR